MYKLLILYRVEGSFNLLQRWVGLTDHTAGVRTTKKSVHGQDPAENRTFSQFAQNLKVMLLVLRFGRMMILL